MAKWRNRTCKCGKIDFTASKSDVCMECSVKVLKEERVPLKEKRIAEERAKILEIYGNVDGPTHNKFNSRCYTFTHALCGTTQTWNIGNLLKQLKTNPNTEPCSKCGGKLRTKLALDGYLAIYKREYDLEQFNDFQVKVRRLSEVTWRENQAILNPNNVKRSMKGWHLDHIVPIIVCFKEGITTERAACLLNLRIISASANLARSWYDIDRVLLEALR